VSRRAAPAAAAALIAAVLVPWGARWARRGSSAPPPPSAASATTTQTPHPTLPPATAATPAGDERAAQIALWESRLALLRRSFSSYCEATRYPPECRPYSDALAPHRVPPVTLAVTPGRREATATLWQDRMFLVGDEAAQLRIACALAGRPVPCEIAWAFARALSDPAYTGTPEGSEVPFTVAADGTAAATFQPRAAALASGTVQIDVSLRIAGVEGATGFQLQYTREPPATFSGAVRDRLAAGSLDFVVGVDVRRAGRYELMARVEDARGRLFAVVSANEELAAGEMEVPLRLFGKLILDAAAPAPFRLRDLEGFRLLADASPDRELMVMRDGIVHTTGAHAASSFSPDEWQDEERERHQARLARDIAEAERQLEALRRR
jgi:hypothetical protein